MFIIIQWTFWRLQSGKLGKYHPNLGHHGNPDRTDYRAGDRNGSWLTEWDRMDYRREMDIIIIKSFVEYVE